MKLYFNDNEKFVCDWTRNIWPEATVDSRSILDVKAEDVANYDRVHLFSGIGGWERALDLAGYAGPAWTGSCPCQPFSAAGKRKGTEDARHLWPEFRRLVAECHPPIIFGEQVASKDGRLWLAGVRSDLEDMGYAVGAADLCAAGIGAPHIRQRLYWMAYSQRDASEPGRAPIKSREGAGTSGAGPHAEFRRCGNIVRLGDSDDEGSQGWLFRMDGTSQRFARSSSMGSWGNYDAVECADGKTRRFESGSFPLAHGVPARVGRLRAYGNSIVPALAAEFVKASLEAVFR